MAYEIGVVGLGVMGANLARNMAGRGFRVIGYDLDPAKISAFAEQSLEGATVAESPARLAAMLDRPRRLLILVPAGEPVDVQSTSFCRIWRPAMS
jgi:6-phosphogluconate dehydrogenase